MHISVSLIIKPTKSCNAFCKHCCVDKINSAFFTVERVKNIISNFLKLPIFEGKELTSIECIWHGGEPMLMQPSFYYDVYKILSNSFPHIQFIHGIQTNLLLYDKKWDRVFNDIFQWRVSSSYDFFSTFRRVKNGDYYNLWMEKVKRFQDKTGKRLHFICILSKENIDKIVDICSISYETGLNIKLNSLYTIGEAKNIPELAISEEEYTEALEKAFKFWVDCKDEDFIFSQGYDFKKMVIDGDKILPCPVSSNCTGYIFGIEPNGDFYNCSECADLKLNKFGNLLTNEFNINNYAVMKCADSQMPLECIECGICGSGCKKQKYLSYGSFTGKTPMCVTWKKLYSLAKQYFTN